MAKIKKGDMVYVITGDSRGSKGAVLKVDTKNQKVLVQDVNMKIRHVKPSTEHPEGGKITKEHPLHISNVALVDPDSKDSLKWSVKLSTKVGFRIEDGKKVRYAKRSGKTLG